MNPKKYYYRSIKRGFIDIENMICQKQIVSATWEYT